MYSVAIDVRFSNGASSRAVVGERARVGRRGGKVTIDVHAYLFDLYDRLAASIVATDGYGARTRCSVRPTPMALPRRRVSVITDAVSRDVRRRPNYRP